MSVTHLYLVRHAETQANLDQRWYGALDAPLTARGEQQVAATAAYFAESAHTLPVDVFYVSPLPRAQSTAAAIAGVIHITPPNGESPVSFGRRIVQTFHDLVARHPGQTILTVSHGAVIASLLDIWLGSAKGNWVRWDPHNCAVTLLAQNEEGWIGVHVNDISHLPAAAVVAGVPEYYERSNR
jgi:broad specificity phosphatase PhoE